MRAAGRPRPDRSIRISSGTSAGSGEMVERGTSSSSSGGFVAPSGPVVAWRSSTFGTNRSWGVGRRPFADRLQALDACRGRRMTCPGIGAAASRSLSVDGPSSSVWTKERADWIRPLIHIASPRVSPRMAQAWDPSRSVAIRPKAFRGGAAFPCRPSQTLLHSEGVLSMTVSLVARGMEKGPGPAKSEESILVVCSAAR